MKLPFQMPTLQKLKLPRLNKKMVLRGLFVVIALFICAWFAFGFMNEDPAMQEKQLPPELPLSQQQKQLEKQIAEKQPEKTVDVPAKQESPKIMQTPASVGSDIAQSYPFYIEPENTASAALQAKSSAALPMIPSYQPRPNLPKPMIPEFPQGKAQEEAEIKGVFVGGGNKNIAILNNGKIVEEGDVYQNNKIAYIGGDGIHFENGTTMKYK